MEQQATELRPYTVFVEPGDFSFKVHASSEKEARRIAWDALSDAAKDACACLEIIED